MKKRGQFNLLDKIIFKTRIARMIKRVALSLNRNHLKTPGLREWREIANPWHTGRLAAWTLGWPYLPPGETVLGAIFRIKMCPTKKVGGK